ncbi:MAG: hypothetical protein DPW16_12960 [Chloroflexi bacterium]|nr:hypothetical protein [Chloroflexota bacterium]
MAIYEDLYEALISISRRKNNQQSSIKQKSHQASPWWQVYVLTAISLIALFAIPSLITSSSTTKILEVGLVLLYYRTILRWVQRHEATLNQEALEDSKLSDLSH